MLNINKVNKLYKSDNQKDLKNAFDLFEKENWTLKQIIDYVLENHIEETYDKDLFDMVDGRTFSIGPLCFKFVVHDDWEPLDIETDKKLVLYITLKDIDGNEIISSTIKNIQTETLSIVFIDKEDIPSFAEKMDECLWKVFENVDLTKTKNLYQYISSYYVDYLDKINIGEIELYNWRWEK